MILDAFLLFSGGTTGVGNSDGKTDSPTTGAQVSSNVIDLGVIAGIPSSANGGGARDIGVGDKPALKLSIIVTTPFTGGTSLIVTLDGAPDNGAGVPGAYTVMWTSPIAVVEALLTQGAYLANVDVPRVIAGQVMPRFLRLTYTSAGTHGAGALMGAVVIDDMEQPGAASGVLSGYRAGINVAN